MEELSWIEAAVRVLIRADHPMHYADIKRVILEMGLVPSEWVYKFLSYHMSFELVIATRVVKIV